MKTSLLVSRYCLVAIVISALFSAVLYPLMLMLDIDIYTVVVDGAITGVSLLILLALLHTVLDRGKYQDLDLKQYIIISSILLLLFISVWMIVQILPLYMIYGDNFDKYQITIPLRIILGVLVYSLMLVYFNKRLVDNEFATDEAESDEVLTNSDENELDEKEVSNIQEDVLERLTVKNGQRIEVISVQDILLFQAEGDYVMIVTLAGKYMKELTMKYLEQHLPNGEFVRVHRSYIINVNYISQIELYEKQNQRLILRNGLHVKMSAGGYKLLRKVLVL